MLIPMSAAPLTLMLVDSHDLFRAGLRMLLEGEGMRVVADAPADERAIDVARRTRPDVILADVAQSGASDASALLARLLEDLPDSSIVVFSQSLDDVDIYAAIRAGARGYVLKDTPITDLIGACKAVHAGHACLSPQASSAVIGFLRTGRIPVRSHGDMSDRELDVLRLIAIGRDNNQIADELSISAKTVKNHVSSIFLKLGMQNRVQAAVYAVRTGLA